MEQQQASSAGVYAAKAHNFVTNFGQRLAAKSAANPTYAALIFSLLLVLAIIGIVSIVRRAGKSGFRGVSSDYAGNLGSGGNSPLWQLGSGDAGNGGSVDRAPTKAAAAALHAAWRPERLTAAPGAGASHHHLAGPRHYCNGAWSADAQLEAEALASLAALPSGDSYGDAKLSSYVNAAYDGTDGLSDADLQSMSKYHNSLV